MRRSRLWCLSLGWAAWLGTTAAAEEPSLPGPLLLRAAALPSVPAAPVPTDPAPAELLPPAPVPAAPVADAPFQPTPVRQVVPPPPNSLLKEGDRHAPATESPASFEGRREPVPFSNTQALGAPSVDEEPRGRVAALPMPDARAAVQSVDGTEVEVIRERYPNRSVKIERHVTQDEHRNYINHGSWSLWDPQGNVLATGEYWHGTRHGRWTRWFHAPAIDAPDDAPADAPDAIDPFAGPGYQEFERPFVSDATFIEGMLVGRWTISDAAGRSISAWDFDHGRLNGKAVWWHPNGRKRREVDYVHGVLHGRWLEWDAGGGPTREETWIEGRRQFRQATRHPSGEKATEGGFLSPPVRTDAAIDWWNGVLALSHEPAVEGRNARHGPWAAWHANGGKQFQGEFVAGQAMGRHVWWYPNGQVQTEGDYIEGRREGTWVFYHANGQKQTEGAFSAGMPVGTWVRWQEDGRLTELSEHSPVEPIITPQVMPAAAAPYIPPQRTWSPPPYAYPRRPAPRRY